LIEARKIRKTEIMIVLAVRGLSMKVDVAGKFVPV